MIIENLIYIFLILFIPFIVFLYFRAEKKRTTYLNDYLVASNIKNSEYYKILRKKRIINLTLTSLIIIFLVFSLMRPKWTIIQNKVKNNLYNITFVLDLSRSMDTEDIKPSRLKKSKLEIERFIKNTDNIITSLVVFSGGNFVAVPLTADKDNFLYSLNSLNTSSITIPGTRIGDALKTAENTFIETKNNKAVILITDGEDHEGEIDKVLKSLKEKNISVYAVSVGSDEGGLVLENGNYKKDRFGNTIVTKKNDKLLEYIASSTGGKLYSSEIDIQKVFDDIRKVSESAEYQKNIREYKERFQIFIFIALILIVVSIVIDIKKLKT